MFLILLPLATAAISKPARESPPLIVALGVGAAFVGLALMCLEFALISRIKAAAQAVGEDSLQLFHNLMGVVALLFLIAHPVLVTTDVLQRYLPKQTKRFVCFICGPDPMMDAMEEALPQLGVPRENVQIERFAMV